jgi:hypothetical protein
MKNIFAVAGALLVAGAVEAQSLAIASQDYTVVGDAYSTAVLTGHATVRNETNAPLNVRAKRKVVSASNALTDENYFCWDICYGYPANVSFGSVTIPAGGTVNVFSGYVDPDGDGVPLTGDIKYTFWVDGNTNDSLQITITYQVVTNIGLTDQGPIRALNVYPNPVRNFLNIDYNLDGGQSYELKVVNVLGKVVYARNINRLQAIERVDMTALANGVYFVQITSGNKVHTTRKFLKN